MPFIIRVITDSFSIAILLSISVYNALVYFGRRKYKIEKYNMYFSLFILSIAMYIFFDNSLVTLIFDEKILPLIVLPGIYLCLFFEIIFYVKFLSIIINTPKKTNKYFYICFALFFTDFLLTFISFKTGYNWFNENIENTSFLIYIIIKIILTLIFIYYSVKNRIYKDKSSLILLIGTTVIILYIIFSKIILLADMDLFLRNNYFLIGIIVFIFAYVLSRKFNTEFKELVELKNELEKKVDLRTRELSEAKEKIEKASELKSNFFINISHEIKTPLTLIENYLNKHIEETGESAAIQIVKSNIMKLKNDIINILDIEKINKGKILYNHNMILDFSGILKHQLILFKEIANKKQISINEDIDKNLYIKTDLYALDRIINNLIDNSIKYTNENGKINVTLKTKNEKIIFIIEDTGIGISEENKKNIFDPFFQVSQNKSNTQGIGMGLSIVKSIVDELNGKIELESEINNGTKISIFFDIYKLKNNDEIIDTIESTNFIYSNDLPDISEDQFDKNKKTILIVEDNLQMLMYLHSMLKNNMNVYCSKNGIEAIIKLKWAPKPDIILSDIMMDQMDGYELYENIKNDKIFQDVPFIFLTAKAEENEKIEGLTRGAIDYITKPFNIDELKAKISSILNFKDLFKESNTNEFKNKLSVILEKNDDKDNIYETMVKYNIKKDEMKAIELLVDGAEYKEIAGLLNISLSGIKKRIHEIYRKLGIQNKIELIKLFKKNK